ncbi:hypothetical protein ACJMK2_019543 [Sinanodonta woodiana]|uniref:Uncharacterized protein n=1 Tax=Sinanodonta woodiana TaxID=1069815 RepID=A0ABD3TXH3_SINWO
MFESKIESSQSIPVVPVTSSSPADLAARREKVRRRTATPEELLYVSTDPPTLHPVPETVDEHHPEKEAIRVDGGLPLVNGNVEATLMPPPKSLPPRQNSGSGLHRVSSAPSPSLRRKEFTRPSPEPSPVLRRKNISTSLLTRSNSLR